MLEPGLSRHEALSRAAVLGGRYSRQLTAAIATTVGRHGVANRDLQLLMLMHRSPGMTPSAIADATGMARSAVSRSLGRFQREGLVARTSDENDHRSARVSLTTAGEGRVASLEAHLEDLFRSTEPAAKEIISLLTRGAVLPEQACRANPLAIAEEMGSWGAGFVEELEPLLRDYGLMRDIDRYAMFLIYDRGSVRPTALADELLLTTGAVTGVLDHLEGASLIERTRLPNTRDRRAVVVLATDRGADAAQAMLRVLDRRSEALCAVFAQTLRT